MNQDETKQPVELTEATLDDVNGGIGLLLPAVQKVREAAARSTHTGGVNALLGDGSVRAV